MEMFSDPDELKAALERRQMEGEVNALAFQSLLAKADVEEMRALSNTFLRAGTDDNGIGIYYAGVIAGILNERSGLCFGCSKDHSVKTDDFMPRQEVVKPVADEDAVHIKIYLVQYNVGFTEQAEHNMDGEVYCKGEKCKRIFPSLQDRMLRANCPDCEQIAKWG